VVARNENATCVYILENAACVYILENDACVEENTQDDDDIPI